MSNRNPLLRFAGWCLSAALLLAVATSADTFAAPPDHAKGKPPAHAAKNAPLMLETYKSFVVGGERVTHPDGSVGLSGHLYVEAFIPHNPGKKLPPIVMTHSSISGTIFLQRANGE